LLKLSADKNIFFICICVDEADPINSLCKLTLDIERNEFLSFCNVRWILQNSDGISLTPSWILNITFM